MREHLPRLIGSNVLLAFAVFACGNSCSAGLSGENVAVVVNGASTDSLTLANHYVALRDIPESNVVVLEGVPESRQMDVADFRKLVLLPVIEAINSRGIASQIQVVAYSAGFPTGIRIAKHTAELVDPNQKKYQTPVASINSLTFFYRWVANDDSKYLGWNSNLYARGPFQRNFANPFGPRLKLQFEDAVAASQAGEHDEASSAFVSLAAQYPSMHPLRILAAESYARAGDDEAALGQIRMAIANGWSNGRYLRTVEPLKRLFAGTGDVQLPASRERLLANLVDVPTDVQGPIAFSSSVGWATTGLPVPAADGAMPYLLSCVLGVVGENASTLEQAIAVLKRASKSDRTYPSAYFGFSKTKDVRATTRQPLVPSALAWLLSQDRSVEIFDTSVPSRNRNYATLTLGSANLPMLNTRWKFAGGALADNLTSLGGVFTNHSQTRLTSLLHHGAAMSSGAVAEPYSIQMKFPTPMLGAYYAEGVSAIEAYYLTVTSPYQLLIVGDPVCQPFARAPTDFVRIDSIRLPRSSTEQFALENNDPSQTIRFQWERLPETKYSVPTEAIELYVQGKLAGRTRPRPEIRAKVNGSANGVLDCRAVLVGRDPTQPRISFRQFVELGDADSFPTLQRLRADKTATMTLYAEGLDANRLSIQHLGRKIAAIDSSDGRVELTESIIGRGPVRLQLVAELEDKTVLGKPLEVTW